MEALLIKSCLCVTGIDLSCITKLCRWPKRLELKNVVYSIKIQFNGFWAYLSLANVPSNQSSWGLNWVRFVSLPYIYLYSVFRYVGAVPMKIYLYILLCELVNIIYWAKCKHKHSLFSQIERNRNINLNGFRMWTWASHFATKNFDCVGQDHSISSLCAKWLYQSILREKAKNLVVF